MGFSWIHCIFFDSVLLKNLLMLKEIIAVFIGGGIGSSLRYLISKFSFITSASFPYSTFITNIIGCFILGLTLGYFLKSNNQNSLMFVFLTIGVCGGFTTFSTFSNEGLTLINNANYLTFLIYTMISIILGLLAVYFGTIIYK